MAAVVMIEAEASVGFLTSASSPMNPPVDGKSSLPFVLACREGLFEGVHTIDSSSKVALFAMPPESITKKSIENQKTRHGYKVKYSPHLPKESLKNSSTFYWIVNGSSAFYASPPSFMSRS